MKLLAQVLEHLKKRSVASALIGGGALAVRGIARATDDLDLLTVDRAVLDAAFWEGAGILDQVEIRRGDQDDPLAGLVRLRRDDAIVDLVVGADLWMKGVVERAERVRLGELFCPVVDAADLVLTKLHAGGPQDLLDVRLLLAGDTGDLRAKVEKRLAALPEAVRSVWRKAAP